MSFLVSLRVLIGLITINAMFSSSGERNTIYLGLQVVTLKFVKEFISLNSSKKNDFDVSCKQTVHADDAMQFVTYAILFSTYLICTPICCDILSCAILSTTCYNLFVSSVLTEAVVGVRRPSLTAFKRVRTRGTVSKI